MEEFTRCLCGKTVLGYGNNAQPLVDGRCCDRCNRKVLQARLTAYLKEMTGEENKSCPVEKK